MVERSCWEGDGEAGRLIGDALSPCTSQVLGPKCATASFGGGAEFGVMGEQLSRHVCSKGMTAFWKENTNTLAGALPKCPDRVWYRLCRMHALPRSTRSCWEGFRAHAKTRVSRDPPPTLGYLGLGEDRS